MKTLTRRQCEILQYIAAYKKEHEVGPSIHNIAQHFGFKVDNAAYEHLLALERKGYIARNPAISRSIKILKAIPVLQTVW
jgi:repressor LexA